MPYPQHQPQQQQQQSWPNHSGMYNPQIQPQPTGFQPQSMFGQGVVSGSSYGYLNGTSPQQQQQQQSTYNPAQQQLQSPGYIAQFDPYSAIGQGWGETTTTTTTITSGVNPSVNGTATGPGHYSSSHINTPTITSTSASPSGDPHPRGYIRTHKALIESWDNVTWKGLLDLFEKLKVAWEQRKKELEARVGVLNTQVATLQMQTQAAGQFGYAGYLQVQQYQQEVARVQGVRHFLAFLVQVISGCSFFGDFCLGSACEGSHG